MRIKVYGVLRDYFGEGLDLSLGGRGGSVSCKEVLEILIKREPRVSKHVSSLKVIKGMRVLEGGELVDESEELLLFPPSSGG